MPPVESRSELSHKYMHHKRADFSVNSTEHSPKSPLLPLGFWQVLDGIAQRRTRHLRVIALRVGRPWRSGCVTHASATPPALRRVA
jgi:hypothetical protein